MLSLPPFIYLLLLFFNFLFTSNLYISITKMQDNSENYDIEVLTGNESEIIEMVSVLFLPT